MATTRAHRPSTASPASATPRCWPCGSNSQEGVTGEPEVPLFLDSAHANVLHLDELLAAVLGAFAPQAGLLHAAKRRDFGGDEAAIHAHHAVFERFRHAPDAADVAAV